MAKDRATGATQGAGSRDKLETAELFQMYAPFVWRALRRLGLSEDEADDACQEVFMTALRKLAEFEGRSSPRTWLYGICLRIAADHRKRARCRREELRAAVPEPAVGARQEEALALREAWAALDSILDLLDDEKPAVFVLYEIEELSMSEVATAAGCPLQTAYSRLHAARREVTAALARRRAKQGAA